MLYLFMITTLIFRCPKWLESLLQKLQQRSSKDVTPLSIVICALPSTLTSVYSLYSLLSQVNPSMVSTTIEDIH